MQNFAMRGEPETWGRKKKKTVIESSAGDNAIKKVQCKECSPIYLSIMAKKLPVKDQGRRDSEEESRNRNAEQSLAMLMIPPTRLQLLWEEDKEATKKKKNKQERRSSKG